MIHPRGKSVYIIIKEELECRTLSCRQLNKNTISLLCVEIEPLAFWKEIVYIANLYWTK